MKNKVKKNTTINLFRDAGSFVATGLTGSSTEQKDVETIVDPVEEKNRKIVKQITSLAISVLCGGISFYAVFQQEKLISTNMLILLFFFIISGVVSYKKLDELGVNNFVKEIFVNMKAKK